jgi:hypothetical protein
MTASNFFRRIDARDGVMRDGNTNCRLYLAPMEKRKPSPGESRGLVACCTGKVAEPPLSPARRDGFSQRVFGVPHH